MSKIVTEIVEVEYSSFGKMWWYTTLWNTAGTTGVFFLAGVTAAVIWRKKWRFAPLIPAVTILIGAIFGFFAGAIYSLMIAALYVSGGWNMPTYMAAFFGLFFAGFNSLIAIGRSV